MSSSAVFCMETPVGIKAVSTTLPCTKTPFDAREPMSKPMTERSEPCFQELPERIVLMSTGYLSTVQLRGVSATSP